MASTGNDRVTLFFATQRIIAELYQVKDLTEIRKIEKEDPVIGQATEDALRLETLQRLAGSSSFDLRAAALRIISERSTKGTTKELLLDDLAGDDPERREKALNALNFLVTSSALGRSSVSMRLKDVATFSALVDCLCNFLHEHTEKTNDIISPICPQTRPPGENKALKTLSVMLPGNLISALEAGVVSRWLTYYPFPCVLRDKSKKRSIVFMMKTWWADDPAMGSIVNTLSSEPEGLKHLRKFGLMGSRMEEHTTSLFGDEIHDDGDGPMIYREDHQAYDTTDSGSDADSDVWMVDGEATAGISPWLNSRPQETSAEEQALRRRRREAMVFSEGSRPLVADNIFHPVRSPDSDLPEEDWELGDGEPSWDTENSTELDMQEDPEPETTRSQWLLWPF
ncbi:hypothetical protein TMEN_2710 [Trichophyton mentagrophytes]|uniref:Uncharacterized protein n=1 Tax=Trichophyton interdigitale (strain MR816) TaxID=1215338 RepID=A0A059J6I7_TRIIM|nr:hypothetical protein H101_00848 [Trichophyton interdigitale H6]KDB23491.1 hypothetical protein H109_04619 [Trichophyton interdigitale MR816]GBF60289.1 hypothetical protein TMEN_2710 [Trichophyton mentagrophytes]